MKIPLATIAFLLSATAYSHAASLRSTNMVDMNFTVADGTPLDSSFTAKFGYTTSDFSSGMPDYDSILADWTGAGETSFASGGAIGYNGYFDAYISFTDAVGVAGKNVFSWVTDGENQNFVMKSLSSYFPSDASIPSETDLHIEVARLGDFEILLGSYDAAGVNVVGYGGSLVAVPEPSVGLLGTLGVLCLIRRRRS